MTNPQKRADAVRSRVEEDGALRRMGVEVLWAAASAEGLALRARHRDRVITLERDGSWLTVEPLALATQLAGELVMEALGTDRPVVPAPLWRRRTAMPSAS